MLSKTGFSIDTKTIDLALENIPSDEFRSAINEPTGRFFYDPWQLKKEFYGTAWQVIYESLPLEVGEARIIRLDSGKNYISHADIDDRYHLNLSGVNCFLIDLENGRLHQTVQDGIWYEMDAGLRHSAINFGNRYRYQLVVRKLLKSNQLKDPCHIEITNSIIDLDEARYWFDDNISPYLNRANKQGIISNFVYSQKIVSFNIERSHVDELMSKFNEYFSVNVS